VDLAESGITDFGALTAAQVQTILELNVAHAIEARICNDIGSNSITLPQDAREAADIQVQLFEFVERSVSDAFVANQVETTMTKSRSRAPSIRSTNSIFHPTEYANRSRQIVSRHLIYGRFGLKDAVAIRG